MAEWVYRESNMKDDNKASSNYNPIKEQKNERNQLTKVEKKTQIIIDHMEEEDRIRELQRRARIEHFHKERIKRIQNYQMRLAFTFMGVGVFSLISGYWIGAIMHTTEEEDVAIMTDGMVAGAVTAQGVIHQDWKLQIVNNWNPLQSVVPIELSTLTNGIEIDARIEEPLLAMIEAGKSEAGLDILVCSGYRSKERQTELFNQRVEAFMLEGYTYWDAYAAVAEETALPGTSEHELGLAVDLVGRSYQNLDATQSTTGVAIWLEENCHRFGFILRYPEGKEEITGISYESWHFRYVGTEVAKYIMENELTLEEYLDN